jgi:hypothetical protein
VQDLGQVGAHALALPGREDDDLDGAARQNKKGRG